jgi:CRISPR system Cascade subunit CasD
MPCCLILVLEGPLVAFGAEMVDARGPVRDWPGASLLTGLLANALGWTRGMGDAHDRLQARLDFAVALDRPGTPVRDFQTAALGHGDTGWTTFGMPEGRAGGAGTYDSPHIRERDYRADASVRVALMLREAAELPTLDDLAAALTAPARPLFLGRKPCLPSRPVFEAVVEAPGVVEALAGGADDTPLVMLDRPGLPDHLERLHVTDQRNFRSGVHGGERVFRRGRWTPLATGGVS